MLVIIVKLVFQGVAPMQVFGETMMFVYFGYAAPMSLADRPRLL